jgi:hypothetical protein
MQAKIGLLNIQFFVYKFNTKLPSGPFQVGQIVCPCKGGEMKYTV